MRVGLSAGTYFKGVQVVLVWKYSESEEEPRPLNITLRTARAYAARDRSWQPVRNSSSHIEPPLIYDNREHYWVPPAPLGALGGSLGFGVRPLGSVGLPAACIDGLSTHCPLSSSYHIIVTPPSLTWHCKRKSPTHHPLSLQAS